MKNVFKLSLLAIVTIFFTSSASLACNPYKNRCSPFHGNGNPEEASQIYDKKEDSQAQEDSAEDSTIDVEYETIEEQVEATTQKTDGSN